MKRLWIGVGIMISVICILIAGNVTINSACEKMTTQVIALAQSAENGDYDSARQSAQKLKSIWTAYHAPLSAIKNHEDLHDLMVNINLLEKYTKEEAEDQMEEACDDALIRLEHIKDGEKISFGNIF